MIQGLMAICPIQRVHETFLAFLLDQARQDPGLLSVSLLFAHSNPLALARQISEASYRTLSDVANVIHTPALFLSSAVPKWTTDGMKAAGQ